MKRFRWLQPGMGVKRWLAVVLLGCLLMVAGSAHLVRSRRFNTYFEDFQRIDIALLAGGVMIVLMGVILLVRSLVETLAPERKGDLGEMIWRNRVRIRGPKIVAVGGGTGLSVLLKGMKAFTTNITAVVTVADDGGSSGRLREDLKVLPPGDVRNCLVALARSEDLLSRLDRKSVV